MSRQKITSIKIGAIMSALLIISACSIHAPKYNYEGVKGLRGYAKIIISGNNTRVHEMKEGTVGDGGLKYLSARLTSGMSSGIPSKPLYRNMIQACEAGGGKVNEIRYLGYNPDKSASEPGDRRFAFTCRANDGSVLVRITDGVLYKGDTYNLAIYESEIADFDYRSQINVKSEADKRLDVQREYQQKIINQRLQDRPNVTRIGARVCQRVNYSYGSDAIFIGTVEEVAGDRIKVFMERAVLALAPGVSKSGFSQHYTWLNYLEVERCVL